jgi:predicted nucleic acid-binding protein
MAPEYVVDASVAAKWFLNDERHTEEATAYLEQMLADEIRPHAPAPLQYEFGNILTKAQRDNGRPIGHTESVKAFETFHEFPHYIPYAYEYGSSGDFDLG